MAHKITEKISKSNYIQACKKSKKVKRLRAYARALVNVANTVNIVSTKFAWKFINIKFLQCILKAERDLAYLTLPGINSQILGPSYQKDSTPNELVLDFCG